ncbi:hypothetical protein Tco_1127846 [Tanacetum coccineum]
MMVGVLILEKEEIVTACLVGENIRVIPYALIKSIQQMIKIELSSYLAVWSGRLQTCKEMKIQGLEYKFQDKEKLRRHLQLWKGIEDFDPRNQFIEVAFHEIILPQRRSLPEKPPEPSSVSKIPPISRVDTKNTLPRKSSNPSTDLCSTPLLKVHDERPGQVLP